jgi:hypothetical protein
MHKNRRIKPISDFRDFHIYNEKNTKSGAQAETKRRVHFH